MQTNQLQRKNPNMKRMTVARGGKRGKTAGRGGKGQSARAGNKRRPEWRDIIKKLPKLRGRGVNQNKPITEGLTVVNVDILEAIFKAGDVITPAILVENGIIETESGRIPVIKILGEGEVTKAFKLSGLAVSASALEKINKAGGSVELTKAQVSANSTTASRTAKAAIKPEPVKEEKKVEKKPVKVAKAAGSEEKKSKPAKKVVEKK